MRRICGGNAALRDPYAYAGSGYVEVGWGARAKQQAITSRLGHFARGGAPVRDPDCAARTIG